MVKRRSTLITSLLWQLLPALPVHHTLIQPSALPSIKFWWIARVQRCSYCASPGSSTLIASQFDRAAAQAALMQHRRPHQVFLQAVLNHNRCWTMHSVIFSRCIFSIESVSVDKPSFSHIISITCSLCLKIATWVTTTNNLLSVLDQLILCDTTLLDYFCHRVLPSYRRVSQKLL